MNKRIQTLGQAQVKHNIIKIFLCSLAYELKLCVIYDLTTFAIKKTETNIGSKIISRILLQNYGKMAKFVYFHGIERELCVAGKSEKFCFFVNEN